MHTHNQDMGQDNVLPPLCALPGEDGLSPLAHAALQGLAVGVQLLVKDPKVEVNLAKQKGAPIYLFSTTH